MTLNIAQNRAPVAASDSYGGTAYSVLTVPAPGVLNNDADADGQPLQAVLVSGPAQGSLVLSSNGGFAYAPPPGFTGNATFSYQATDGSANSGVATVMLAIGPAASPLFSDSFARTNEPGALAPWFVSSGAWTITQGLLQGGTNSAGTYGYLFLTNNWTDYALEGKVRLAAGAFGGGLGGRLNPATGAHYAAWLYPAGSSGGSNVLKLIKFKSWTFFGYTNGNYTAMAQASVPPIGTNWHTLRIEFQGSQVSVSLDGISYLTLADAEAQPPLSGGVVAGMWTDATGYQMTLDDVLVTIPGAAPQPSTGSIKLNADGTVTITFIGTPGAQYWVQRAPSLTAPISWTNVATNTAGTDGKWTYSETASPSSRFFRSAKP